MAKCVSQKTRHFPRADFEFVDQDWNARKLRKVRSRQIDHHRLQLREQCPAVVAEVDTVLGRPHVYLRYPDCEPTRIATRSRPVDVFDYIFINVFQVIYDVFYVFFDLPRDNPFLQVMTTLLTGDLIRAARALIAMSQVDLAKKAGITQKALSDFELGKQQVTARANEKLRRVFDEQKIQFIAANVESSHLEGTGVRWKPSKPNSGIKTI